MIFDRQNVKQLISEAKRAAKDLREVGGLLVDHGPYVRLVPVRNATKRRASFLIRAGDWKAMERAAARLGSRAIGTFHSHVISKPVPGKTDIRGAVNGHAMVILDGLTGDIGAWRIRAGRAYRLKHEVHSFSR